MADRYGMDYTNDTSGGNMGFSSPGASNTYNNSQTSPSNQGRKATEEKTLIPVTIRMILNSTHGQQTTLEDGRELDQVKVVAAVRGVSPNSTAYSYQVEDGTGFMEVKEWVDQADPMVKQQMRDEAAVEHQYVRIIGKVQTYDDKLQIVAYSVRKLTNGNELTHHFLEVVNSAEKYKRSSQIVGRPSMNGAMSMMNTGGAFGGSMPSSSVPIGYDASMNDGGGLKSDILNFLNSFGQEGGNINLFIQQNQGKYSQQEIHSMLEAMSGEGNVYSTTDEFHYAAVNE